MQQRGAAEPVVVSVGFVSDEAGEGIAYGIARRGFLETPFSVAFQAPMRPALEGRDIGYAALLAVGSYVRQRGVRNVVFSFPDARVANDLKQRADVPAALTLPYIELRCSLNRFEDAEVVPLSAADADAVVARAAAATLRTAA